MFTSIAINAGSLLLIEDVMDVLLAKHIQSNHGVKKSSFETPSHRIMMEKMIRGSVED
jgi:hypothetical protein